MPASGRLKSHAGGYNNIVTQRLPDELDAHRHALIVVPGRQDDRRHAGHIEGAGETLQSSNQLRLLTHYTDGIQCQWRE